MSATFHPATTEEGRRFLQRRLALAGQLTFLLSAFFFVFNTGLSAVLRGGGIQLYLPTDRSSLWHLGGAAVSLALWGLCSARRRFTWRVLVAFDAAALLLSLGAYAMMYASGPLRPQHGHGLQLVVARTDLLMILVTFVILTVRAIVVPSSVRHTALVSVAGAVPAHLLTWWLFSSYAVGDPPVSAAVGVYGTSLWCVTAILIAVVTSRVIYGLRAEARAAQRLGQYILGDQIGEGGMGIVYRASHVLLRRPAALKLLRPERAGADTVARFEREVQLTSGLTHPNTVAIFDYGRTPAGLFYYVMEYLDGIDLARLVERHGAQPAGRVVRILEQLCGSLGEAHAAGLVHRDIKPANVILCQRGGIADFVKVLDFGLVKEAGGDATLTGAGAVLGTPLFLSPEAIRDARQVDARADLYAAGALAYFLLAGAPPFPGPTLVDVCSGHLHERPVPLARRAPGRVPPDLDALVLRCLAKDPADRPPSATALRGALLACDVPAWSDAEAQAWWDAHRAESHAGATAPPAAATLDVEVLGRAPTQARRAS